MVQQYIPKVFKESEIEVWWGDREVEIDDRYNYDEVIKALTEIRATEGINDLLIN